ncbi:MULTISPECIES: DNA-processing protein DprA [unclassified Fusibacter]|uniref:DNA-processing protein DprA n=1 Tax=unclassified Fusibacter TaxID=2624464 RepID=UPI001025B1B3|nr:MULTISPECIES: DNA-processing protein DprA [unclassified Fusibacter]MCK8058747.1 DNA-processing protein DprA [Fusibacter sp. A2]RXV61393.1 DNA-protecting protein DprA [Fusibacter sp. A1]
MYDVRDLLLWLHEFGKETDKKLVRSYYNFGDRQAVGYYIVKLTELMKSDWKAWVLEFKDEMKVKGIEVCTIIDDAYPERLLTIFDYPLVFYYIGDISCIAVPDVISIVGTRKPTYDAIKMCDLVTKHLAKGNVTVVSGLAFGVDALAHRGALAYGAKTSAVLASGLDHITPRSHVKLARQILDSGGLLLSEYAHGIKPLNHYYVARNRIVSGLASKIFIVEAGLNSGSMTTGRHALDQNKELYVMPGSISNAVAQGTNSLFRQGAYPVIDPEDLHLHDQEETRVCNHPIVMRLKEEGPIMVEVLSDILDMPIQVLMSELMVLECDGFIRIDEQIVRAL